MAKKSVATLQTGSKRLTKAINMVKKKETGTYSFLEAILDPKHVRDWMANKPITQEVIPSKSIEKTSANTDDVNIKKENINQVVVNNDDIESKKALSKDDVEDSSVKQSSSSDDLKNDS